MKHLVVLSGGLDSAANLALLKARGLDVWGAVTFNYGQRAARAEMTASKKFCDFYGIEHVVVDLSWVSRFSTSALNVEHSKLNLLQASELDSLDHANASALKVWVPNRNGVLIHAAAMVAESKNIDRIWLGFNREEAATFPDNSIEFIEAVNLSLKFSTRNGVQVDSATKSFDKREIVARLRAECPEFRFDWVYSCYAGADVACGECESCLRLTRALGF